MNLTRTLRNSSGVLVAFSLLLSGCSSDSGDSGSNSSEPAGAGSSEQSQQSSSKPSGQGGAFDQAAAKEALLTEGDLPAGYTAMSDDQIASGAAQAGGMGSALDGMTIEPKTCEVIMKAVLAGADLGTVLDQGAVRFFTNSTAGVVSQLIAPADLLASYQTPDSFASECSTVTMSMPGGGSAEATTTEIDVPDYGNATTAFVTDMSMDVGGQSVNIQSASAYVEGNTGGMALGLTGGTTSTDLESQLTDLLEKAYNKAESVIG